MKLTHAITIFMFVFTCVNVCMSPITKCIILLKSKTAIEL